MATILKEFEEIKSVSSKQPTYICFDVGTAGVDNQYILFDELRIAVDDSNTKPVTNIKEMKKALQEGKLYQKIGSLERGRVIKSSAFNLNAKLYKKTLELPKEFISDRYQGDSKAKDVPEGLNRVLEVKRQAGFSGSYVYCQLVNTTGMQFYHMSEIGYVENDKFVSLESLGDALTLDLLESKVLFNQRENKLVNSIFTDATCTFGKVVNQERVDDATLTKTSFEYNSDGSVKTVEERVEVRYSEHVCRKAETGTVIDSYNYQISPDRNGDFIKVQYEGYNVDTLVNIASLHYVDDNGNPGDPIGVDVLRGDNRFSLIGKPVCILLENEENKVISQVTKPLTMDQLAFNYDKLMSMQETTNPDDALSEDAYLKLANGKYIKESEVAHPICYDFVKNSGDDFDAYYVIVEAGGVSNGVIVNKNAFKNGMTVNYNGVKLELKNAYKIKRSHKEMRNCDIIQTTKKNLGVESCVALSDPKYDNDELIVERKSKTDNDVSIAFAQSEFEKAYRLGEYTLDEVLDDEGNYTALKDSKRYIYSDHITVTDYSHNTSEYSYFNDKSLTYDGKKLNGKSFDMAKANKAAFKKFGKAMLYYIPTVFGGAGIVGGALLGSLLVSGFAISTMAATVAINILVAGIPAVWAISIPIVNAIRSAMINRQDRVYNSKLKLHRKGLTDEITKDFEFITSQTKIASKNNKLNKDLMLDKFESIEQKILSLSEGKLFADFRMVDGKGQVDETNAELFSQYRLEMRAMEKEIKSLEKRAKKDPSLKKELEMKKELHQQKLNDYVSQGIIEPKDKNMRQLLDKSNTLKGYLIKRYYSGELSEQEKRDLDLVYDDLIAAKDTARARNLVEGLPAIKELADQCRELGAQSHYDYEHNVINSPKYEAVEVPAEAETLVDEEELEKPLEEEHRDNVMHERAFDPITGEVREEYLEELERIAKEEAAKVANPIEESVEEITDETIVEEVTELPLDEVAEEIVNETPVEDNKSTTKAKDDRKKVKMSKVSLNHAQYLLENFDKIIEDNDINIDDREITIEEREIIKKRLNKIVDSLLKSKTTDPQLSVRTDKKINEELTYVLKKSYAAVHDLPKKQLERTSKIDHSI